MLWSLILISLIGCARLSGAEGAHCKENSNYSIGAEEFSKSSENNKEKFCSFTGNQINSWWKFKLPYVYSLSCISILYQNHDRTSNERPVKIYIGIFLENGPTKCMSEHITYVTVGEWSNFHFDPTVSGRYVTVFSPEIQPLDDDRVLICGTEKVSPFELIKENKTWVDALEYCRDHNMHLASIVNEETQAWAELKARDSDTPFMWLGLRYTCTLEFWFWVEDLAVEFNRWAPNSKKDDCNMSGAMAKDNGQWFSKSGTEKFNFICAK